MFKEINSTVLDQIYFGFTDCKNMYLNEKDEVLREYYDNNLMKKGLYDFSCTGRLYQEELVITILYKNGCFNKKTIGVFKNIINSNINVLLSENS